MHRAHPKSQRVILIGSTIILGLGLGLSISCKRRVIDPTSNVATSSNCESGNKQPAFLYGDVQQKMLKSLRSIAMLVDQIHGKILYPEEKKGFLKTAKSRLEQLAYKAGAHLDPNNTIEVEHITTCGIKRVEEFKLYLGIPESKQSLVGLLNQAYDELKLVEGHWFKINLIKAELLKNQDQYFQLIDPVPEVTQYNLTRLDPIQGTFNGNLSGYEDSASEARGFKKGFFDLNGDGKATNYCRYIKPTQGEKPYLACSKNNSKDAELQFSSKGLDQGYPNTVGIYSIEMRGTNGSFKGLIRTMCRRVGGGSTSPQKTMACLPIKTTKSGSEWDTAQQYWGYKTFPDFQPQ